VKTVIIRDLTWLRARVREWRRAGEIIGVVPTMGALHEGHLELARIARKVCDRVIVTIFVNPKQFNNAGDLEKYPRTEEADARLLEPLGIDVIFAPNAATVYPHDFSTTVSVAGVSEGLCGAFRPGHFDGVATVVAKLFLMTQADKAFFGEKDYQQLMVVRRMARDLNIAIDVIGCPTVREPDGLAMSSRNRRLTADDRRKAPQLYRILKETAHLIDDSRPIETAIAMAKDALAHAGFSNVEYVEFRAAEDLAPLNFYNRPARLLAAAWLGDVRLIDNIQV
jgi:pantoate--beta-alanine ligase